MKKQILILSALLTSSLSFSQTQIGNSDFELWQNLGADTEEPTNWNSFMTASGGLTGFAAQQLERSTSVRPGSTGSYSARIWSRDAAFGIVANGNMTLGRVNMGNSSATNAANYNYSITADGNFSEALTDQPDSIVFWVKYNAANGGSEARVSAALHDTYDYKDGYNVDAASAPHKVAEAILNFSPTGGNWVRKSIPWSYVGPASVNTFILITFTSNKTPGGGNINDEVFIDDLQLVYNQQVLAQDDAVSTYMNNAVQISVLANDTDYENSINIPTITIVTPPTNGGTSVNTTTGVITYTPDAGYIGADAFTYSICDNGVIVTCDNASVSITVADPAASNNPVVSSDDNVSTPVNTNIIVSVLDNDNDPEGAFDLTSLVVTNQPSNGLAAANLDGTITYIPDGGFQGFDSFTYEISDLGTPTSTDGATVTVNVSNVGIDEVAFQAVSYKLNGDQISFVYAEGFTASISIVDLSGRLVASGAVNDTFTLENNQVYIINVVGANATQSFKVIR
ncbi:MAG: Ig-like domain-containing protein [Bacteroidota bacterium]